MKTIKIFAIAAAVAALAACTKEQAIETGSSFKKGQEVTLSVTADMPATKVTSELNGTSVDFKWQEGDKIKVKVGVDSAVFTITSFSADSTVGTFTGTMPADGSTFDVQYPVTDPTLTAQTYSSTEAIPHNMMKFAATGCSTSSPFSLSAQNAVLRLNLWGTSQTISKIVVTNTTSSADPKPTYTLNFTEALTLPTTEATAKALFIVVPAGTGSWNFSAEVFDNAATPSELCTFTPSAAQSFTVNGIVNMPAKEVRKCYPCTDQVGITIGSTVWAPVNCGYDATNYPYGKLYQWGRKDGCGYNDGSTYTETLIQTTSSTTAPIASTDEDATVFYKITSSPNDWLTSKDDTRWNSGKESSPVKTSNDPCPTGWRVPTKTELTALLGGNTSPSFDDVNGQYGCYFNGTSTATSGVFLPAAGCRYFDDGNAYVRGDGGYYWSSSVNGDGAWLLFFYDGSAYVGGGYRAGGYSVRCVQE